jgi:hypothetical protein
MNVNFCRRAGFPREKRMATPRGRTDDFSHTTIAEDRLAARIYFGCNAVAVTAPRGPGGRVPDQG